MRRERERERERERMRSLNEEFTNLKITSNDEFTVRCFLKRRAMYTCVYVNINH